MQVRPTKRQFFETSQFKDMMKELKCYKCDSKATGREHIPPISIFPESKDSNEDFRKNLLTVPSCDEHNLKKTKDDEFLMMCLASIVGNNSIGYIQTKTKVKRALERKYEGFIEKIIENAKDLRIKTKEGLVFPILSGKPDLERLHKCVEYMTSGIYYHEFGKQLKGQTNVLFGFIEYEDKNTNQFKTYFKDKFESKSDKYPAKGSNPKIFYYQIVPPDKFGIIALKLTFYGGTDIFISVKNENSKEPFDLVMQLIKDGVKTRLQHNGKDYEFN